MAFLTNALVSDGASPAPPDFVSDALAKFTPQSASNQIRISGKISVICSRNHTSLYSNAGKAVSGNPHLSARRRLAGQLQMCSNNPQSLSGIHFSFYGMDGCLI